jgi:amidase
VRDLARLLDVQAGFDPRVPMSLPREAASFVPPPDANARGLRVGWLGDLGGHLAMEAGVLAVCEEALQRFAGAGAIVEPATLGVSLDALWEAWMVWRRALTSARVAPLLARPGARELIKPEALWECEQAQGLVFADFQGASQVRSAFSARLATLFERYDLLALPSAQVWPFPLGERWPAQIGSRTMDTYHRWMEVTLYATFGGLPAISVPAGFHANGRWPMGLQLIGPAQGDAALLRHAAAYEACSADLLARRPAPPV